MRPENSRCLVLNADYTPLGIIDWRRALVWYVKYENNITNGIDIVDFYKDDYISGVNNKKIPIPAVVKTKKYFRISQQSVNFSRKNLFIRDNYTCQYCGETKEINKLTYDHIIPKSQFKGTNQSPTTWTNIVTACIECNRKKGNKTPKQAGMPLKNLPYIPNKSSKYLPIGHMLLKIRSDIPKEWFIYLPESYL